MPSGWRSRIALAAALLAGCRHVAPEPLSPAQIADRLEQRTLADPGLRDFIAGQRGRPLEPWPHTQWTVDDLTFAALFFSPDLNVARAIADVATAQIGTASERPNPTLSFAPQRVIDPE